MSQYSITLHNKNNWFVGTADTASAGDGELETETLESTLQQTVNVLRTKQQQLEDEQKQVVTVLLVISCSSLSVTSKYHGYY